MLQWALIAWNNGWGLLNIAWNTAYGIGVMLADLMDGARKL